MNIITRLFSFLGLICIFAPWFKVPIIGHVGLLDNLADETNLDIVIWAIGICFFISFLNSLANKKKKTIHFESIVVMLILFFLLYKVKYSNDSLTHKLLSNAISFSYAYYTCWACAIVLFSVSWFSKKSVAPKPIEDKEQEKMVPIEKDEFTGEL